MLKPIDHSTALKSRGNLLKMTAVASLIISCGFAATANAKPVQVKKKPAKVVTFPDKKLHFNGITLTPGGYIQADYWYRSRTQQADIATSFGATPYNNAQLAHMQEYRASARQTRLSMLLEGNYDPSTKVSGYVEVDFQSAGRSGALQSASWDMRIRHAYTNLDWVDSGWHMLAGQAWSLITQNKKGIAPRTETLPITIESNTVVGSVAKRLPQFRLTKNFGESLWAAISIETPQNSFATPLSAGALAVGTNTSPVSNTIPLNGVLGEVYSGVGTGILSPSTAFSTNHIPDIIGKLAYDAAWFASPMHLEVFGVYRDFYNRVQTGPDAGKPFNSTFHNMDNSGGGVGGSIFWEAMPKFLDIQATVFGGRGIGSYFYGGLPDVTLAADGGLAPISEIGFMAGAIMHATPALDLYVYGGSEKEKAQYFNTNAAGTTAVGFGAPVNINNTGCEIEGSTACSGLTKNLWEVTVGAWQKLYNGNAGQVLGGLQYAYVKREAFPGYLGNATAANGTSGTLTNVLTPASANNNTVYASVRYLPFTAPAKPAVYK